MGSSKEKLLYVLELLRETDEDHPMTAAQLVARLRLRGIEAERKSVLRDIHTLYDCGYDIAQCADNRLGYYLASREFEDWELKVLMDAVQSARFLTEEDAESLLQRLRMQASADSRRTLGMMTFPTEAKTGDSGTKLVIDTVLRAMRRKKKIHFEYMFTDETLVMRKKHPEMSPVTPYALVWRGDTYYLIGNYCPEVPLSYYRVDRMKEIRICGDAALPLQELLGSGAERRLRDFISLNVYNKKGRPIALRLGVLEGGVDTLRDSFGKNAHITRGADGTLSAAVRVSESEGLYAWLLEHSGKLYVLGPDSVREEMRRRLSAVLRYYS